MSEMSVIICSKLIFLRYSKMMADRLVINMPVIWLLLLNACKELWNTCRSSCILWVVYLSLFPFNDNCLFSQFFPNITLLISWWGETAPIDGIKVQAPIFSKYLKSVTMVTCLSPKFIHPNKLLKSISNYSIFVFYQSKFSEPGLACLSLSVDSITCWLYVLLPVNVSQVSYPTIVLW